MVEKRRQYLVEEQELEEDLPDIHKQQHAHLMELMVTATEIDGPKWLESELELDSVATSQPEELPSSLVPGDTELPQSGPNQPELTPDVDQFVFRSDSDVERTVVETLFNKQG